MEFFGVFFIDLKILKVEKIYLGKFNLEDFYFLLILVIIEDDNFYYFVIF